MSTHSVYSSAPQPAPYQLPVESAPAAESSYDFYAPSSSMRQSIEVDQSVEQPQTKKEAASYWPSPQTSSGHEEYEKYEGNNHYGFSTSPRNYNQGFRPSPESPRSSWPTPAPVSIQPTESVYNIYQSPYQAPRQTADMHSRLSTPGTAPMSPPADAVPASGPISTPALTDTSAATPSTGMTTPGSVAMSSSGDKADEPYAQLIYRAFMSRPEHAMTLQEIYQWFRENTDKPKSGGKGWQNSIRHNLSMNGAFTKRDRPVSSLNSSPAMSADEVKKSTVWILEDWAVTHGVQSTTRYRKDNSARRVSAPLRGPMGMLSPHQRPRAALGAHNTGIRKQQQYARRATHHQLHHALHSTSASHMQVLRSNSSPMPMGVTSMPGTGSPYYPESHGSQSPYAYYPPQQPHLSPALSNMSVSSSVSPVITAAEPTMYVSSVSPPPSHVEGLGIQQPEVYWQVPNDHWRIV